MNEVEQTFIDNKIPYVKTNNPYEIKIQCYSGLHEDTNPSLHINTMKGLFNCFSCGFKGTLNQLYKDLALVGSTEPLAKQTFKIEQLKNKLHKVIGSGKVEIPEDAMPYTWDFRHISGDTMSKFGAFTTSFYGLSDYICIPVYQNNKLVFIEARHITQVPSKDTPKYMRKPNGISVDNILFPFDIVQDKSTVILVEGLYDAINMHDLGYTNTLCIFGTQNFSAAKAKLLDEYGCRKAIIMMDGDNPGVQAAKKIKTLLTQRAIVTSTVELKPGEDPGSLDKEYIDEYLKNT